MTKVAAIIGGVLLMAGVALAGTVSSLGATGNPTIGSTPPTAAATTTVHREAREDVRREDRRADRPFHVADDHGHHHRGRDDGNHRGHGGHGGDD